MMEIRYGISNWIYGEEPIEEHFKRLKKYGYDAIEIRIADPSKFDTKKVNILIDKYKIPCCSICTLMDWNENKLERRNLIDQDLIVRNRTLNYLKSCLEIGTDLEANLILAVPSGVWNMLDAWTPEHIELCVNAMQELGDHARSLGTIKFVIEPLNRYENQFLRRCEQALELLKKANHPQVKMMLDCFHMNIEEDNNADAIRAAGSNLIHFHIADSNRKSSGRGQSDWFEIFRALRDIDYHGSLVCETILPTGKGVLADLNETSPEAELYAKECIEYLKFIENII